MSGPARSSAPPAGTVSTDLERRAARARLLAGEAPEVSEPLRFAAGLYAAQARAADAIEDRHARGPLCGTLARDVACLVEPAAEIYRYASEAGPPALAEAAGSRRDELPETASARLLVSWEADRTGDDYLSRAALRPYVAVLRRWNVAPNRPHRPGRCPFCGGAPSLGALRDGGEMEGARRFLVCALCGEEWAFARLRCPACSEEDPYKLPSFRADTHAGVRIEVCETCRRYVKSFDLSEDARPIPEVDDLLSLSLDLWARAQGFERIEPGLAGI